VKARRALNLLELKRPVLTWPGLVELRRARPNLALRLPRWLAFRLAHRTVQPPARSTPSSLPHWPQLA
jgi:hypothetical protein